MPGIPWQGIRLLFIVNKLYFKMHTYRKKYPELYSVTVNANNLIVYHKKLNFL